MVMVMNAIIACTATCGARALIGMSGAPDSGMSGHVSTVRDASLGYRGEMYRSLSMYPTSADPERVAEIVERTAAAFKQSPGFRSFATSVDALMGPGARDGQVARVVVVDFDALDDALSALNADSFQETRIASEALGATHFLFECREV
jgi:hypothetical protein